MSDWDRNEDFVDGNWSDWNDDSQSRSGRRGPRRIGDNDDYGRARREAARRAAEHIEDDEVEVDDVSNGDADGGHDAAEQRARRTRTTQRVTQTNRAGRRTNDRLPPPPRRGSGCLVGLIVLGLLAGSALYAYRWVNRQIDPGKPGETIEVSVPTRTSLSELGVILKDKGVIRNVNVWRVWTQLNPPPKFQAGKYKFAKNSSFKSVVQVIAAAPEVPQQQPLTVPPGLRITQVAQRVAELPGRNEQRFLDAAKSGTVKSALLPTESAANLEGFIAAETINFDLADDETKILSKLVDEWDTQARDAGIMKANDKIGYTPYQVLIVASLIEREAKFDDERAKVARVIYNRLKADMYLQLDATTVYDLGGGQPTTDDLKKDAPYNTYTRKGLPPTPISTVSLASLNAALAPAEGDWLYYVVTEADGHSSFASSFKEHKANIAKAKKSGVLK